MNKAINRDMDDNELIVSGLMELVRKELQHGIRAIRYHGMGDPNEVRHHMERAKRALELRQTING